MRTLAVSELADTQASFVCVPLGSSAVLHFATSELQPRLQRWSVKHCKGSDLETTEDIKNLLVGFNAISCALNISAPPATRIESRPAAGLWVEELCT